MFTTLSQRALLSRRICLRQVIDNVSFVRHSKSAIITTPRFYSALSQEEEEKEKARVATLSKYQKEVEMRDLDKEISRLNTLRGIASGELYTFRGKFKALARDYGIAFMAWYWTVWMSTAALTYTAIEFGNIDAMAIIAKADVYTGFDLSSKVDPTLGTIGLTIAVNEMLEPIRLPFVVLTTKPIVETIYPNIILKLFRV